MGNWLKKSDSSVQCYHCNYYKPETSMGGDECLNPPDDLDPKEAIKIYWTRPPICPNYKEHLRPTGEAMTKWYKEAAKMSFPKAMSFLINEMDAYQQWIAKGDIVALIDRDGDVDIKTKKELIDEAEELKESFGGDND